MHESAADVFVYVSTADASSIALEDRSCLKTIGM